MAIIHEVISPKDNADDILLVRKLYFANNEKVNENEELIDLETSKTAIILDAPICGFIEYVVKTGQSVRVGEVVIRIHDKPFNEELCSTMDSINSAAINMSNKIISYAAERYIKENNLDISHLQKHFITYSDLIEDTSILKDSPLAIKSNELNQAGKTKAPNDTTEVVISLAKQNEIKALSGVQSSGLVSTIFISVDSLTLSYDYETDMFKSSGSYLPIIIFEVSRLLKTYPLLNAYYDEGVIRLYDKVSVGVALDIDDGLKVCSLRDTDGMSMPVIENGLSKSIDDYLNRCLTPEQLTGSTFTITDLSSFGVDGIVPLVNFNQSAILGISSIDQQLNRMNLSLSFDHRVTEGKLAGLFLVELKQRILSHTGLRQSLSKEVQADVHCNSCMKTLEEDRAMKGVGLIKIINHDGEEQLLCQACMNGWS